VDCDDADEDVSPAAEEVCNHVDDDCDGETDEGVSNVDYPDADRDGFGDDQTGFTTCGPAAVLSGGDCDDDDAGVSPAAAEACNGIDDDCDGEVDDGVEVTTWPDEDGDGYGAGEPAVGCDGGVTNDRDCDDADPAVNPAADDLCDDRDDDCDGAADDDDDDCDGTVDVPGWAGNGVDGALRVTEPVTLDDAWAVSGVAGRVVTLAEAPALAVGDEVLLVNLHGTDDAHAHVGEHDFATVTALARTTVTLDAVAGTYTDAGQAVQLVRVAQFTDVTVESGGLLAPAPWDGATGGVLAFRVQGTLSVADGGAVSADALGYAGGAKGAASNDDASQGESYAGTGDGQHSGDEGYNQAFGCWAANYGGGGAHITGGGGEHAGGATAGDAWYDGVSAPEAGEPYGDADLARLFLGSGGGGVWNDGGVTPADGGDGGGLLFVAARDVVVEGAGGLSARGGDTTGWASGSYTYGAGGGAGGTVWLVAESLSLATEAVDATGGLGEDTHTRRGGHGGDGRVRVDCVTVGGAACAAATLADGVEPDAGYVGAPG
jgi:hypothetical protein